jgi:hypothetical protein
VLKKRHNGTGKVAKAAKLNELRPGHKSSDRLEIGFEPEAGTGIKNIVNEACSLTLRLASWAIEPASGWHHWISGCKLHLVSAVQLDELLSSCVDPWEKRASTIEAYSIRLALILCIALLTYWERFLLIGSM